MREKEAIEVYVKVEGGKTLCVCPKSKKHCKHDCELDILERDRYRGWEETMHRDKYGK